MKNSLLKWHKLMQLGEKTGCHQMPKRSFFVNGYQFPVCARCFGALLTSALAIVMFFVFRIPFWLAVLFCAVMFLDWLIQFLKIKYSTNVRRFITGLLGGYGWATVWMYGLNFLFSLAKDLDNR